MYANNFENYFDLRNFEIVEYYPYTSRVSFPFLSSRSIFSAREDNEQDIWMKKFWSDIENWLLKEKCIHPDNKTVVKLKPKTNNIFWHEDGCIYVGCHDDQVSIGLSVYQPDSYTSKYNQKF